MIGVDKFFEFQERCIEEMLSKSKCMEKSGLIIKSPTGSGKTLILLEYIDRYLNDRISDDTVFIWFTPGAGELEEQSQKEMEARLNHREALLLEDVLNSEFTAGDTVFINWEQVNKSGNTAMTDDERHSLLDKIKNAHRSGLRFIIIVDEEHIYNTPKSQAVIECFSAEYIIRASATAKQNNRFDWFEIPEIEVISEGLITKALYINEDLPSGEFEKEYKVFIDLADKKRKDIKEEYMKLGLDINPMILIQFPDKSKELIEEVETYLEGLGYSYNREMAKWLADDKDKKNLEGITKSNGNQIFLLMKQAVATGWNCPRAKILIKLRAGGKEDFKVQTIGRLRRMPQAKHYDNELLDTCYLYTLDDKFQQYVKQDMSSAHFAKHIKLKQKCETFMLNKENRDEDYAGMNQKDIYNFIKEYFLTTYNLKTSSVNRTIFMANDYHIGEDILLDTIQDHIILTDELTDKKLHTIKNKRQVNTHDDGIDLRHVTDTLKTIVGVSYSEMNSILRKLFLKSRNGGKILNLSLKEYYAFIINNESKLKEDIQKAIAEIGIQNTIPIFPKISTFKLPLQMLFQYEIVDELKELKSNAYYDYTTNCFAVRSKPECLFEQYCDENENVEWIFKNGDVGQEFFSIVYSIGNKQRLFYPDYIVKLKNEEIWIIETKGGETASGANRNIDKYAHVKFKYLKKYAETNEVKFGFVREKTIHHRDILYLNNTQFSDDMDDSWKPLSEFF